MTGRRRVAGAALTVVGAVGVVVLTVAPARAQAPDIAAWWSAANVGNGAPAPPAPPDVASGDLLVQGSNAAPAAPVGGGPASAQAVAGLAFDLPSGALVGPLTLAVDGTPPPQVSVVACRATSAFFAEENGPWTDVPGYDANTCVPGALQGNDVVFADAAKLVHADALSVVLLPGPLDRVVFARPGPQSLSVSSGGGGLGAAPPLTAGGVPAAGTASAPPQVGGPAAGGPAFPGPGGAPVSSPPAAPVLAPSPPAAPNATGTRPVAASSGGLTDRQRRIAAGFVIALEVVGFLLLATERGTPLVPVAAGGVGAGRLRPPDRVRAGLTSGPRLGGVGRFAQERTGPPPRL